MIERVGRGLMATMLVLCAVAGQPRFAAAQTAPAEPKNDSVASSFGLVLPVPRPLTQSVPVPDVWRILTQAGTTVHGLLTASLATDDLREYAGGIEALFPPSQDYYPADSIRHARIDRAGTWLAQLDGIGSGIAGQQRLALASVAFQAERDTLARHYIDARLAEVAGLPVERALALTVGVALFVDREQDDARRARNFPIADAYAHRLLALPSSGYRLRGDSLQVWQYKMRAVLLLVDAADALPPRDLVSYVDRCLAMLSTLPHDLRHGLITGSFPYRAVAIALMQQPNGRAAIDALNARLLAIARRRDNEWEPRFATANHAAIQASEEQDVRDSFGTFEWLGHPAPPIQAHAWLNTSDSLYTSAPRTHAFDDGVVRVIAFGTRREQLIPRLDRIQRHFPSGVQVVFVTQTEGHGGPDLLSPSEETEWLRRYYRETRHVTFAVALWAAAKTAQEAPPTSTFQILSASGEPVQGTLVSTDANGTARVIKPDTIVVHYQRYLPARSPMPERYRILRWHEELILLDGHGLIRGYQELRTRADEARLIQQLTVLRHQPADASPVTLMSPASHATP